MCHLADHVDHLLVVDADHGCMTRSSYNSVALRALLRFGIVVDLIRRLRLLKVFGIVIRPVPSRNASLRKYFGVALARRIATKTSFAQQLIPIVFGYLERIDGFPINMRVVENITLPCTTQACKFVVVLLCLCISRWLGHEHVIQGPCG